MKFYVMSGLLFFASVLPAHAKPLSYPGGWAVEQENDHTGHTLTLSYTVTPDYAFGFYVKKEEGQGHDTHSMPQSQANSGGGGHHHVPVPGAPQIRHMRDKQTHVEFGPQVNTLVKRWNFSDGQANIFNMSGAGISRKGNDNGLAAWTGFLMDYETRRIFISYEPKLMVTEGDGATVWQRGRIGFAPYLANYEDLNTWLMLQADHHPHKEDTMVVTPLTRFYYKAFLLEAGYSSNDKVMFNWRLQF